MREDVTYWYEGRSPRTGEWLRLPRTRQLEAIAREFMQVLAGEEFYNREGKMYGLLLVEDETGEQQILKAFSGLLNGESVVEGWVPPIPGREQVAFAEALTLAQLDAIKQELLTLQQLPERSRLTALTQQFTLQRHQLALKHQQRKELRQQQRQTLQNIPSAIDQQAALEQLNQQSQQDGIEKRRLKQHHKEQIQPLQHIVADADAQIQSLKQQRKQLSRQLQTQMYQAYRLTNFAGESVSLQQFMVDGVMPTGTGECCAPKLLHYAAVHRLKPIALAEFWWGPPSSADDKVSGEFYGACRDRCQPLMGFLLSGLEPNTQQHESLGKMPAQPMHLPILYEDEWLIAVEKPAGLLSVPGRYRDRQDSVLHQLRLTHADIRAVHRLDQDTSGILLFAKDLPTYRQLSQQFQQRQVHKVYEALLDGAITVDEGVIELPLWANPACRPQQEVDWLRGKLSITKFRVLQRTPDLTRITFFPITGRTHQLRVHAAHTQGLGVPIRGDRLYGHPDREQLSAVERLHLHAKALIFQHPHSGKSIHLQSAVPF